MTVVADGAPRDGICVISVLEALPRPAPVVEGGVHDISVELVEIALSGKAAGVVFGLLVRGVASGGVGAHDAGGQVADADMVLASVLKDSDFVEAVGLTLGDDEAKLWNTDS